MSKKILPFAGVFYNQSKISRLQDVMAPPYDVITPEMQNELYAKSPYNFCRVDFSREVGPERYEVSKNAWHEWLEKEIIVRDAKPGLYFHCHTFRLPDGKLKARSGFFAARRLEDFSEGGVKPHEKTLDAPKADRLSLMTATEMQFSPVFSLYNDPQDYLFDKVESLLKSTPCADFMTVEGERHQLWKLRDPESCDAINKLLEGKPLFIADGHHRYETALNYRNQVLAENPDLPDDGAARFILMYFCNMHDTGLVILPIHRVLHSLTNFDFARFHADLAPYFEIRELDSGNHEASLTEAGNNSHAFVLQCGATQKSYLLTLSRDKWQASDLAKTLPPELSQLDVTVLHKLVFEKILGISEAAQARQENITYCKSAEQVSEALAEKPGSVAFFLNPTRLSDMESVALAGHKMPQKSTFFYPKVLSGLVMHAVAPDDCDG